MAQERCEKGQDNTNFPCMSGVLGREDDVDTIINAAGKFKSILILTSTPISQHMAVYWMNM